MSASSVGKHTLWNILGQVAPILMAIVAIPLLVQRLGLDRFGFLTLVWVLIGYVGVFDLGVGRAMTRVVAARLGAGDKAGAEESARAALTFLLGMGVVVAVVMLALSSPIVRLLAIPPNLQEEALNAFRILSFSLPIVMLTSGYRGYLEARREFGVLNVIRVGMGILTYAGPLIATALSPRLEAMVAAVLVSRVLGNYAHRYACLRCEDAELRFERPSRARIQPLLQLGGWMTVSSIISPLMNSVDRLLVGGLATIAAIGMYATAYDVISKTLIVAYSLSGAMFPMLAASQDSNSVRAQYATSIKAMTVIVWPVLFVASLFSQTIFDVWMGEAFAVIAAPALQILAVGFFFNALAQMPAVMIQSRGQPRWMAQLHLAEVPFFLGVLYYFTQQWGVLGTAAAWSARAAIDAIILAIIVDRRLAPNSLPAVALVSIALLTGVLCAIPFLHLGHAQSVALCVALLGLLAPLAWFGLLNATERAFLAGIVVQRLKRKAT